MVSFTKPVGTFERSLRLDSVKGYDRRRGPPLSKTMAVKPITKSTARAIMNQFHAVNAMSKKIVKKPY